MRYARRHIRWSLTVAAAIGLVLMLPGSATAQGNSNETCATSLIAKFEAVGPDLVFDEGTEDAVTIVSVETDEDNEPTGFEWTSTIEVGAVIVKGGQEVQTFPGDATTIDFDSPPAISNVQFCAPDEDDDAKDDDAKDDDAKDDDAKDDDAGVASEIPLPTRVDTGAGGAFTGVTTRLIRRRG
jgi:hypothetical protein